MSRYWLHGHSLGFYRTMLTVFWTALATILKCLGCPKLYYLIWWHSLFTTPFDFKWVPSNWNGMKWNDFSSNQEQECSLTIYSWSQIFLGSRRSKWHTAFGGLCCLWTYISSEITFFTHLLYIIGKIFFGEKCEHICNQAWVKLQSDDCFTPLLCKLTWNSWVNGGSRFASIESQGF